MPDVLPEGGAPAVARTAAAGARVVERDGAGAAAQALEPAARDESLPLGAPAPAGGVVAGELHCRGDRRVRGARRQCRVRGAGSGSGSGWRGGVESSWREREGGRGERGAGRLGKPKLGGG